MITCKVRIERGTCFRKSRQQPSMGDQWRASEEKKIAQGVDHVCIMRVSPWTDGRTDGVTRLLAFRPASWVCLRSGHCHDWTRCSLRGDSDSQSDGKVPVSLPKYLIFDGHLCMTGTLNVSVSVSLLSSALNLAFL